MEEQIKKRGILDKTIDFLFSNDQRKWLIPIFLVGLILRFIVSRNISPLGDEMIHGPHAINFLNSGLISTILHSPLWFSLEDIFMRIFGITLFAGRFASLFYGTLSILLIYLIGSRFFNRKVGLISAFLLSISYFTIRYTLIEMDLPALFFLLIAVYSFYISLQNKRFPYLAAIALGLAALIKTLSLFFVPAFIIGFFLFSEIPKENRREEVRKIFKKVVIFGIIILVFFSPILVHNYLWYKDKGMVDVYFAQYFHVEQARQAYVGVAGFDKGLEFFISETPENIRWIIFDNFAVLDPLIGLLGLLGILLFFIDKTKFKEKLFLILFNVFGLFFMMISTKLQTHITTMIPVLCIFSALFLIYSTSKIKDFFKLEEKKILTVLLLIIAIFQIYLMIPNLTSSSGLTNMREYAINSMDKNSLVIADSRIYRGRIAWLFSDYHYIEASLFSQLMSVNANLSGIDQPTTVYFIECARDDCGWGTIKDQPDFNASMETFVKSFSDIPLTKRIYGGGGSEELKGELVYNVYKASINLKPSILQLADSTHDWFYYPVNYFPKEKIFDSYAVNGILDKLLHGGAKLILYLSIIIALILSIYPFINLARQKE